MAHIKTRTWLAVLFVFAASYGARSSIAQASPASGTAPFVLDGNRSYVEVSFLRSDGSLRKTHAYVDMGSPTTAVSSSLLKDLQVDEKQPVAFELGTLLVRVPREQLDVEPGTGYSVGAELKVEAMLAAGLLKKFQVIIDYRRQTLTLGEANGIRPQGVGVSFRINEQTGLIAVDASIDGHSYPITIDNGSAYSWIRQNVGKNWLADHPQWERGLGAVGVSNMMMSGDGAEASGILLRIPEMRVGAVRLGDVGMLAAGHGKGFGGNSTLFDWYSTKNALPVIGWLGGNVLKDFRLTIDYPHRMLYWLKQMSPDLHELDQVGITLQARAGEYFIAAIAQKNGKPTVDGVKVGDKLLRVEQLTLAHRNWGAIFSALHGMPGDVRTLVIDRAGEKVVVLATVTGF
jgi:hypothetical protein